MTTSVRTVAALVAYDGTDYHGFQVQAGVQSVQGVLEQALDRCCRRESRVVGAGRTDAGVHAGGQVVTVSVAWAHDTSDLERAWNVHLPSSVGVRCVQDAPVGFHPRFSAVSRTYRYTVQWYQAPMGFPQPRSSPLTERYALFETRTLDVAAMNEGASHLIGAHDFATFGRPPQGESTERRVIHAEWEANHVSLSRLDAFPGVQLVFTITANAFLRQMVRNIVGTLLQVGRGERSPESVREALAARDRSQSAPPAAPQGLVLERVTYPDSLDRWIHADTLTELRLPDGTNLNG